MRAGPGDDRHIINIASLSALGAGARAVDVRRDEARACSASPARSRATCSTRASRSRCTRSARTPPTRRCCASTTTSRPRRSTGRARGCSRRTRWRSTPSALLDSKKLVRVVPRWRGWGARATAMARAARRCGARAAAAQAGRPPPGESDERRSHVTETTTVPSTGSNGAAAAGTIEVENPATGKVIASVPVVPPEEVAELVARARRAQPGWEALGFDGRAAVMKRCQKWVSDNSERVIETIVSETGKAYEEALVAEIGYAEGAFALLGQERREVPRRGAREVGVAVRQGPQADRALRAARRRGRDRALELPAHELVRRLHPGADGRQRGAPEAVRGHAAHVDADGRDAARVRAAGGRLPGGARLRRDRRGADRRGGLRDVHRLDRHRQEGDGARRADAHAGVARAGRQGPDDRVRGRRPRAGRERRGPLLDAERRPDLHLDRARVRRGADLRRVRAARDRQGAAACARACPAARARPTSAR